jgi:protein translocase SecG subunit
VLVGIQVLAAVALTFIIAIQTTKSEQGGGGLGWGTIGGQASSSVHKFGLDAQITRLTTIIAVVFLVSSLASAMAHAWLRQGM